MILDLYLQDYFRKAGGDRRLRRPHMCLYLALLTQSPTPALLVNSKEVISHACIGTHVTYHRCMRELQRWDYVDYLPSYAPVSKSRVYIKLREVGEPAADAARSIKAMSWGYTWI